MPWSAPMHKSKAQAAAVKTAERDRGNSTARGYGLRHRKWRRIVLHLQPICVGVIDKGHGISRKCHNPATVADHIVPLSTITHGLEAAKESARRNLRHKALAAFFDAVDQERWVEFIHYGLLNGRGLCSGCHNRRHAVAVSD